MSSKRKVNNNYKKKVKNNYGKRKNYEKENNIKTEIKDKKANLKRFFAIIIFIICFIVLFISIFNIIKWKIDANKTNKQINDILDKVTVDDVYDNEDKNIEVIEPEPEIDRFNPYWDYIKMNLIDVNFLELKSINEQTKGWIQVNGTSVNYPFVQAEDNSYYLTHSFDKGYNSAGWVFLDYRNNIYAEDKNTIIYAHGRLDNTMFGSLKKILNNGWLSNSNNYIVKLSTEYENTLWQVFSVYHIPTNSDYLQILFNDNNEFLDFANILLNRSFYNFGTSILESDRILTLSTCYNEEEKLVLHAKLIKREAR